jgi:hypothetical protein
MTTTTIKTPQKLKLDLYKAQKQDYAAPRKPLLVTIGEATYLGISGKGEPGGEAFTTAIGALYGIAFTVKMTRKFSGKQDYAVCKLEAQWWADAGRQHFLSVPRTEWKWELLIRTPDFVSAEEVRQAAEVLLKRGKVEEVKSVRLESFEEGCCVQMLHTGPYDSERETIDHMMEFALAKNLEPWGRHHEIYLSDPRRVPAERLKTILRQPVRQKAR